MRLRNSCLLCNPVTLAIEQLQLVAYRSCHAMSDAKIQQLIELLKAIEQPEQCRSHTVVCKPGNMVFVTASRAGFIRIARACLEAAVQPIEENDCRSKSVEFMTGEEQVLQEPHDYTIGFFQRMETWPEPKEFIEERVRRGRKADRMVLFGCGLAIFLFCLLLVGFVSLFAWFGV